MRAIIVLLAAGLAGCATLVTGTSQNITITTDPSGALCKFESTGDTLGMVNPTPGSVRVPKSKDNMTITCSKDGYKNAVVKNDSYMIPATIGNVVAGGLIGIGVDAISGANFEYDENMRVALDFALDGPASKFVAPTVRCPEIGSRAGRSNATAALYVEISASNPDICVEEDLNGKRRSLYFALEPIDGPGAEQAYAALKSVLRGGPGATATYTVPGEKGDWKVTLTLDTADSLTIENRVVRARRLVATKVNESIGVEGQLITWLDPIDWMPVKRTWTQTRGEPLKEVVWTVKKIDQPKK